MASVNVRMDIHFASQLQGWTEQYYMQTGTDGFTEKGVAPLLQVVNVRAKLSPYSVAINGVRVVNTLASRQTFKFVPTYQYPTATATTTAGPYSFPPQGTFGQDVAVLGGGTPGVSFQAIPSADPDIGVLIDCYDVSFAHRRGMIIRGIPTSVLKDGGAYGFAPTSGGVIAGDGYAYAIYNWWDKFQNWINQITGVVNGQGPLLMRATTGTGSTDPNRVPVVNLAYGTPGNNYIDVTTAAPVTFDGGGSPIGKPVTIRGYKGGYRVNGQWRVAGVTFPVAPSITPIVYHLGPHRRNVALDQLFPVGVSIQGSSWTYPAIVSASLAGRYASEHRTGRPFGAQAGRRAAR